jgi:dihydroorotase-like cyclic amidohydrolase
VAVAGGRIVEVGTALTAGGEEVDAGGLWVLPGAVDAHVHSRDPGFLEKEDFGSLTAAAAAGGVTTVVDMPNTVPAVDSASVFEEKAELASSRALVDFALWGLVRSTSTAADCHGLLDAGAVGLKLYLGYALRRNARQVVYTLEGGDPDLERPPGYGTLARLAPELARRGAPVAVHCEDPDVLRELARPLRSYADLLASRPPLAEAIAVEAVATVSLETGLEAHVVHLSSAAGVAAARRARAAGARLEVETCPQYLWLTAADFERMGGAMMVYPPVRGARDRDALLQALREGVIDRVATDHAPHTDVEKLGGSLHETAPGSPGVQTLYLSCLELARRLGDAAAAVRWAAEAPARALGLDGRKGAIRPGADADLVLVDPGAETVVTAEAMHSRQRRGALEGRRFGFAVRAVWSRGELVSRDGSPVAQAGRGRLVRRGAGRS